MIREAIAGRHVLIVGGGIAGLAAALELRSRDTECRITIAESTSRLGGKIAGETVDGCVIDGGADVCIGAKLRATELFRALELADQVVLVNQRQLPTFESRGGVLAKMPTTFTGELLTFRGGMQELVALSTAGLFDVQTLLNTQIVALAHRHGRWLGTDATGATLVADAVIIATPARAASALLRSISVEHAVALDALAYPPTTTVSIGWSEADVPTRLEGTGYLVAERDGAVTACTWTSSKNPSHAATGVVLLRGYLRGMPADPVSAVRDEVAGTLGIVANPLFTRVYQWPEGIPVYTREHENVVRTITDELRDVPGVFLAGSAFNGVGIPDCIHSGERAALSAERYLAQSKTGEAA